MYGVSVLHMDGGEGTGGQGQAATTVCERCERGREVHRRASTRLALQSRALVEAFRSGGEYQEERVTKNCVVLGRGNQFLGVGHLVD